MGISANLYINNSWELRDLVLVMEKYLDLEPIAKSKGKKKADILVQVKSCAEIDFNMYQFYFKIRGGELQRQMYVHTNSKTPLGTATYLSLGSNDESIKLLATIAEVLGGILCPNDCDGNMQWFDGSLTDDDGIPYFVKRATLENKMESNDDMHGLQEFMTAWKEKHKRN